MKDFRFNTIAHFDKHISDSIHGYDLLDSLIMNICSFYAKEKEGIVDLGCSSGRLINKLANIYHDNVCRGYDIIDNNFKDSERATLIRDDITRDDFIVPRSNIILSIFTLQFLQYAKREPLLKKIYNALNDTGVFIVCEKEICDVGIFQDVFTFSNWDYKKRNFTSEEILWKEEGLRTSMNCMIDGYNEVLFRQVGFTRISQFFQSLNFKGWLVMK